MIAARISEVHRRVVPLVFFALLGNLLEEVLFRGVFTLYEGVIAGFVRLHGGVLAAALTHGWAIFVLAAGWV